MEKSSQAPVKGGERIDYRYDFLPTKFGRIAVAFGVLTLLFGMILMIAHGGAFLAYALLFLLSFSSCVWSFRLWRQRHEDPDSIWLGAKDALLPRASLKGGTIRVAYREILSVKAQNLAGQMLLVVETRQGQARVWAKGFPHGPRFVEFADLLVAKWKGIEQPRDAALSASPPSRSTPLVTQVPDATAESAAGSGNSAILRAIQLGKKSDPFIGAKFAGKEVFLRISNALAKNDPQGVHSETLLCVLGALAGYACQASLRAQALIAGKSANGAFTVVKTKDGKEYFFGDEINRLLAEDKLSVWSVAAGAAQRAGVRELPDLHEIFKHTAASVGSEAFGVVRYPGEGAAKEPPIAYLRTLWPLLLQPLRELTGDPKLWPLAFGLAIQQAIESSKDSLGPEAALTIAMEAAVPMSKVKL